MTTSYTKRIISRSYVYVTRGNRVHLKTTAIRNTFNLKQNFLHQKLREASRLVFPFFFAPSSTPSSALLLLKDTPLSSSSLSSSLPFEDALSNSDLNIQQMSITQVHQATEGYTCDYSVSPFFEKFSNVKKFLLSSTRIPKVCHLVCA